MGPMKSTQKCSFYHKSISIIIIILSHKKQNILFWGEMWKNVKRISCQTVIERESGCVNGHVQTCMCLEHNLPMHGWALQGRPSSRTPSHKYASSGGDWQVRVRVWTPPPHSLLHSAQLPHTLQPPVLNPHIYAFTVRVSVIPKKKPFINTFFVTQIKFPSLLSNNVLIS